MAAEFEAIPTTDVAPSSNGTTPPGEQAPRRRGRPPRDPNAEVAPRRPRRASVSLEVRIGAFIAQANIAVTVAAAFVPGMDPERDPLELAEIVALTKAIDAEARNHATFRKYLERALAVGSAGQLWLVLIIIAGRRGVRHGVIPGGEAVDNALGLALADPAALAAMMASAAPPADMPPDAEPATA